MIFTFILCVYIYFCTITCFDITTNVVQIIEIVELYIDFEYV